MKIRSIRDVKELAGKTVLLRADFNVPLESGTVREDYKIAAGLPTIEYLVKHKCRVAVATHLGDPGGKKVKKLSTEPVAARLSELSGIKVSFVADCLGAKVKTALKKAKAGEVVFLENLRYYPGEEENSRAFARKLAEPFDLGVNNAFAVCHRDHASVGAIKKELPTCAGFLLEQEIVNLNKILKPVKPLTVIIGGAKVSTKLPLIANFIKKADYILVGGAIANDFLSGLGFEIGRSVVGKDQRLSKKIAALYKKAGNKKIVLPLDFIVSNKLGAGGKVVLKTLNHISKNDFILDIGPRTVGFYTGFIKRANTLVWNGPMGLFEIDRFKHGTLGIARLVAARSTGKAFGVVGGGETVEALKATKMFEHVDWVSTGGGAMLEYLSGKSLPGLKGLVK